MEPAALPADGRAARLIPSPLALLMAMARPLALKLPVGIMPSSLTQRSGTPISTPRRGVGVRGVQPSPRVTTFLLLFTGRSSQYLHMVDSLPTSSRRVTASLAASRSYRANSGLPPFVQTGR